MKLAKAAQGLGLNDVTLKNWIERPEFAPFFSPAARLEGPQRELNGDDLIVANTIRGLRAGMPNSGVDWSYIAEQLAGNVRNHELPPAAANVTTELSLVDQQVRMATVTEQRDSALQRVNEQAVEIQRLRSAIDDQHENHRADVERLMERVVSAEHRATKAETELELYRSGRLQPERADKNGTS